MFDALKPFLSLEVFYRRMSRWLPWISVSAVVTLVIGLVWGLLFAPPDARQGDSFRIIYVHVPAASVALMAYYFMAVAGAIVLVWRVKLAAIFLRESAPLGAAMTFLALASGSIWGLPTWGAWWVWDARLTSMLILFFLYLGVIALGQAFEDEESSARASAILAIAGSVNVVIVYKSVDWWFSLHQPASISLTQAPSIHPTMWRPLALSMLGFYASYAAILLARARIAVLASARGTRWAHAVHTRGVLDA